MKSFAVALNAQSEEEIVINEELRKQLKKIGVKIK